MNSKPKQCCCILSGPRKRWGVVATRQRRRLQALAAGFKATVNYTFARVGKMASSCEQSPGTGNSLGLPSFQTQDKLEM